ncbi:MAG: RagB/SusD family nutrient uptake outer membrane protein [Sphingobacteriia bacterium]|nr:RagB/SusD family nutrient uptake outer membrane protein [Sphingobacteriia bacterium]
MGLLLSFLLLSGCKKFLDQKPKISDIIPTTLDDLQKLLDNANGTMNSRGVGAYEELLTDNRLILAADWQSYASMSSPSYQQESQNYIWSGNALPVENFWTFPYINPIYYSNIVLDYLPQVQAGPNEKYNTIKGSALFYRAFAFFGLSQLFCKPYSTDNAGDPGIILRLTSNTSEKTNRATIQQTYDRIIGDLKDAVNLLPETRTFATQPSKTAAYALLARVYLSMRDYANAGQYANSALQLKNTLINYNTLIPVGSPPIKSLNQEVIFHNYSYLSIVLLLKPNIDSNLYKSYDPNDLRKTVFFLPNNGEYSFRGSYDGNGTYSIRSVFDGLAVDEMYLIRAESYARAGNKDAAMADLNTLMQNRWSNNGSWSPFTATDAADALNKILTERRKELVWRGLRWSDIRRLNLEGANITLQRNIAGTIYTLPPNDLRSVMLIPLSEINNNPGVQQNPR